VVLIPWFGIAFGLHTIPFLARTIDLPHEGQVRLSARLGPGIPDADYACIRAERDSLLEWRVERAASVSLRADDQWLYTKPWHDPRDTPFYVFAPAGRSRLAVTARYYQSDGSAPEYQAVLTPVVGVDGDVASRPTPRGTRLRRIVFRRQGPIQKDGSSQWDASLGGQERGFKTGDSILVTLYSYALPGMRESGQAELEWRDVHLLRSETHKDIEPLIISLHKRTGLRLFPGNEFIATPIVAGIAASGAWEIRIRARLVGSPGVSGTEASLFAGVSRITAAQKAVLLAGDEKPVSGLRDGRNSQFPRNSIVPVAPGGTSSFSTSFPPSYVGPASEMEKLGRWRDLIMDYRRRLDMDPGSPALHAGLANALHQWGDLGASAVEYRKVAELTPGDGQAHNALAWVLDLAGRYEEALPEARKAVVLAPSSASSWDTLFHAAFGAAHWEEAVRAWDEVKKLDPNYPKRQDHLSGLGADDEAHYLEAKRRLLPGAATSKESRPKSP
jgi:hypothetical protein